MVRALLLQSGLSERDACDLQPRVHARSSVRRDVPEKRRRARTATRTRPGKEEDVLGHSDQPRLYTRTSRGFGGPFTSTPFKMSYIYQWLDVPWGDGDMGSWADRSPLHEAASQGRLLALRTLLAQGYHANIVTIDHVSPLHEACLSGHVACVRALISSGANVNAATIDGVTPLFNCCASGSVGCLELLLQNGAHMHTQHTHFPSALHEACKRGNSQCVETLLSRGADPDYEVAHLGSPLYMSCLHQHTACSKILLHRGANVNIGRGSDTPLHAAVRQDNADQVLVLLDYGADVHIRDSNNQRPVELAPPGAKTQQLLLTFAVSPRSLCQLCRLQIRNLIGRSRLKLLPILPLPSLLTHYLEHE